jgi:hypothetical protein
VPRTCVEPHSCSPLVRAPVHRGTRPPLVALARGAHRLTALRCACFTEGGTTAATCVHGRPSGPSCRTGSHASRPCRTGSHASRPDHAMPRPYCALRSTGTFTFSLMAVDAAGNWGTRPRAAQGQKPHAQPGCTARTTAAAAAASPLPLSSPPSPSPWPSLSCKPPSPACLLPSLPLLPPCLSRRALVAALPRRGRRPARGRRRHGAGEAARHGTARHSTARHGTARHGTARHGTARHSTARHGTARHGTARHSTACPRTLSTPALAHMPLP